MGRGAFDFVLKLGIALPDRSSIFGIGVPKLRTIDGTTIPTDDFPGQDSGISSNMLAGFSTF